ncbi:DnaJ family domain-containing protein [Virgibacillus oceani]|uniref:DnaJ homologue subfamily C member 28 conserved domain-containing protein n=1 Tax=Virgibacillus oceani TaxID=1479511 RepID=A0A917HLT5_9BACI|nr:DUF1992 domain-containing protein [Virgibacillus oceani]GGG83524.1 hypothetical protein GCM10011398_31420 [Virgibacillus oceani]
MSNDHEYTDHMTEIIRQAEKDGLFDDLPGKGKPLKLDNNYFNNPDKQIYKTLKDNNILPKWIKLSKEIDAMKEKLSDLGDKEKRKRIKDINKKIKEYNYACPPSLQKNKIFE